MIIAINDKYLINCSQPHPFFCTIKMELSQSTLRGLQVAGSSSVDDKTFARLAQLAVQATLEDLDPQTLQGK